jgi:hypothetical protein
MESFFHPMAKQVIRKHLAVLPVLSTTNCPWEPIRLKPISSLLYYEQYNAFPISLYGHSV